MSTETELQREYSNYLFEATNSMSGVNGTKVFGGTDPHTDLRVKALAIREDDTAFTSLVMTGGPGGDLSETYFLVGTTALLKGDLLVAPKGYIITSFQFSAGSALASLI